MSPLQSGLILTQSGRTSGYACGYVALCSFGAGRRNHVQRMVPNRRHAGTESGQRKSAPDFHAVHREAHRRPRAALPDGARPGA